MAVVIAALGFVCLGDVAGDDDAWLLEREAANRMEIKYRSALPLAGTIWPLLTPPSLHEPFKPTRSGCQTRDDREGRG